MLKTCSKPNSWKYKFEITVQYYFPLSDIPFQWLQQFSDILTFLLSDRSFDKTKTVLGIFDSRINFHIWAMQQYTISSGNPRGKSFISKLLGTLNMNKSKLKTISFLNIVHTQCRLVSVWNSLLDPWWFIKYLWNQDLPSFPTQSISLSLGSVYT